MPVERCFDWESLTLVSLAVGDTEAANRYAGLAEEDAARLPLRLPTALAGRCRAAVLLAAGEPLDAARVAHESAAAAGAVGARTAGRLLAQPRGARARGRRRARAGDRGPASRRSKSSMRADPCACGTRCAASCGGSGPASEPRGPAAGDSGIDALTKRELEIAGLVTDRMTNREIATALFLSDKTIESHIRNIFHKLGVSSRVDVARAVERERRMHEAARPA